jgi:hypothetical protein
MQAKASALIAILQDALHRVDEDSKLHADDPAVLELRNSIIRGIVELQRVQSSSDSDHSQAA